MTAAEILQTAKADGLVVTLSPGGTLKLTGDQPAVNRWQSLLKEHKAEIITLLSSSKQPPLPEWCNPLCDNYHSADIPGLGVVLGCCRETSPLNWRRDGLNNLKSCPKKSGVVH